MLSNGFNLYPVTPYQYGTGISNHDTLSTTETSKSLMDKVWQQVGKSDLPWPADPGFVSLTSEMTNE